MQQHLVHHELNVLQKVFILPKAWRVWLRQAFNPKYILLSVHANNRSHRLKWPHLAKTFSQLFWLWGSHLQNVFKSSPLFLALMRWCTSCVDSKIISSSSTTMCDCLNGQVKSLLDKGFIIWRENDCLATMTESMFGVVKNTIATVKHHRGWES